MTEAEIRRCLADDHVAGRIIRDCAQLEWELGLLICRYYTAQERFYEFMTQFVDRLSFVEKIDVLRKMSLPEPMKSQRNAVRSLEKFRKLRNLLAHSAFVDSEQATRLASDNELVVILQDFPKNYRREVHHTKNRLNRLMHSYIARSRRTPSA